MNVYTVLSLAEQAAVLVADSTAPASPDRSRYNQIWAMLIERVYKIDPLTSAQCGGPMKVIAFIEPPQGEAIEKI